MPKKQENNSNSKSPLFSQPSIRIVVCQSKTDTWHGCIYYSPIDLSSEVIRLFKTKKANSTGRFQNRPAYFFTSVNKPTLEANISKKIQSLFSKKKLLPASA